MSSHSDRHLACPGRVLGGASPRVWLVPGSTPATKGTGPSSSSGRGWGRGAYSVARRGPCLPTKTGSGRRSALTGSGGTRLPHSRNLTLRGHFCSTGPTNLLLTDAGTALSVGDLEASPGSRQAPYKQGVTWAPRGPPLAAPFRLAPRHRPAVTRSQSPFQCGSAVSLRAAPTGLSSLL